MAKPCERCKRVRYQLTVMFGALILVNFFARSVLGLETKNAYDLLLLPSSLLLIIAIYLFLDIKSKIK